ncbi:leucine-rich repeat-containing protein 15-like [Branchiostoma floridae]|uniref:Leucine-rich repeat-containing protein 15-like n=1 Tax=Branchiostoma floridae TaxID=7739 RepID=A0A9J7MUJ7_BRAFL|nr:leucine-rich repeat-containing protein 15-like [Branchiostoma floridae]XP_035681753.1 leucine-rich repeat-containing protein 15-like [Branchiostoma floridae]
MERRATQVTLLILAALCHISVHGCPTNCTCLPDNLVDCQHGHLTNIPPDIPRGTKYLQLQHNRIRSLGPHLFGPPVLRSLRKLNLSHNELVSVHPDAFSYRLRSATLEVLDLSNNNISSLLPFTFDKLNRLEQLYLHGNNLPIIGPNAFTGLRSLRLLSLQNNQISVIARDSFQHLPTLVDLSLQNNQLAFLHDRTFEGLTSLQTLDLSENRIHGWENDSLLGLTDLRDLRLDFNRLRAIPELPETWFPRNCLKRLNLSHNPIETITDHALGLAIELQELYLHDLPELSTVQNFAFRGLPKLQKLHMHNNPGLNTLPIHALVGLPRIQHINLRNNSFSTLDYLLFPNSWELHVVDLSDNPWDCSCRNSFRDWIDDFARHGTVMNSERTLCESPAEMAGEELLSLPDDYCEDGDNSEDEEEEDDRRGQEEEYWKGHPEEEDRPEPEPEPDGPEVPCSHNACLENGRCMMKGNSAYCRCPRGFLGSYCELHGDKGKLERIFASSDTETTIDVAWTVKQRDLNLTFLVYWSVNGPMQYEVSQDLSRETRGYRITDLLPGSFHRVCVHSNRYNFQVSHECMDLGTLGFSGENPWGPEDGSMPLPNKDPFQIANIGKAVGIGGGVVILIGIIIGVACRIRYLRGNARTEAETPPPDYSRTNSRQSQIQLHDLPPPYHEVVSQGIVNPALNPGFANPPFNPGLVNPEVNQRDSRSSNNTLQSAQSLPTISEENEAGADVAQYRH